MIESATDSDRWIPTVCHMCQNCCGIRAHVKDGIVIEIEANPDNPHNEGNICGKSISSIMHYNHPRRVLKPLRRTNPEKGKGIDPRWEEISWEEALDTIAEKLRKIYSDDPRKLSLTTFDYHGLVPFVRAFLSTFGTPNFSAGAAGFFCGNGFHNYIYATQGGFFNEPDLHYANYLIFFGSQNGFVINTNPMSLTRRMAEARERGIKLVVVDPICSFAASKADEWLPILPGTDTLLALSMVNVLVNELGIYDAEFLRRYTNAPYLVGPDGQYMRDEKTNKPLVWDDENGRAKFFDDETIGRFFLEGEYRVGDMECRPAFEVFRDHMKRFTPEEAEKITTIPAKTIRRISKEYGEAASIGATIKIEGKELPLRPANVNWNRGAMAHKHAGFSGMAIQMLNVIVGAIDVPGGSLGVGIKGPTWGPIEGQDGLLESAPEVSLPYKVYPVRGVKSPESLEMMELFPVNIYARTMQLEGILHPQKYGIPYETEMMINVHQNGMLTMADPKVTEEVYKKIPFILSFNDILNETAYFSDIVLPLAYFYERLDMFPNLKIEWILPGMGYWYDAIRQPVVPPPGEARHWTEVIFELAHRMGIKEKYYDCLNNILGLKGESRLDPAKEYSYPEVCDRWAKSKFGEEHGLEWFKKHGVIKYAKKTVEEAYPRPFFSARIPLYYEHFIRAGKEVERVTSELEIPWDTEDYKPLPEWAPCEAHHEGSPEYDLIMINGKNPFITHSWSAAVPWLNELVDLFPYGRQVLIHTQYAERKHIRDGDLVIVESMYGHKAEAKVKVTECVHPQVVGTHGVFGHWAKDFPKKGGLHFNSFLPYDLKKRMCYVTAGLDACVKVRVYKKS